MFYDQYVVGLIIIPATIRKIWRETHNARSKQSGCWLGCRLKLTHPGGCPDHQGDPSLKYPLVTYDHTVDELEYTLSDANLIN
jgi:hypothetical protein